MLKRSSIFIVILLLSCHIKISDVVENMEDTVPETVIIDIKQVKVQKGRIASKMNAERAETYKKKNEMILVNPHFQEINDTGDAVTEGWADKTILFTDTEDAEMTGNIYFYSETEETSIYADVLHWQNEENILTAEPDEIVTVTKDDGSSVKGSGFKTDFGLKEITFSGKVDGVYIDEEDEQSEDDNVESESDRTEK